MSQLLIDPDKNTFEVVLRFAVKANEIEFFDGPTFPEGHQQEKFVFRRPAWRDARAIMERAMIKGTETVDPLGYMDAKVRQLLVSWSLKETDGEVMAIAKLDLLPPAVIFKLSAAIDERLGGAGVMGITAA